MGDTFAAQEVQGRAVSFAGHLAVDSRRVRTREVRRRLGSAAFGGADFMTTRQDVYELATAIMAEWTKSNLTQSSKSSGVPLAQIGTVR